MVTTTSLLQELQSFPAAGVDNTDILESKRAGNPSVPRNLINDWQNGVYDEDPSYLADELRAVIKDQ